MKPFVSGLKGFTLIELMISLAIGATVTGTGFTLYVQMFKYRALIESEIELQEGSYFINQTLRQYIGQAGYRPLQNVPDVLGMMPVEDADSVFTEDEAAGWGQGDFIQATADGFAIRFEGASDAAGVADGSMLNCQGTPIAESDVEEVMFTIDDGSLICSSDGADVELVGPADGIEIEQFALDWGVDTNNDRSADEYRDATSPLLATERVVALRLNMLLRSAADVFSSVRKYTFDGSEFTSNDARVRRESVTTVRLKH